jgi:4-hydroxybenzoate polyprenyltransferase
MSSASASDWSALSADDSLSRPLCVDLDGTLIGTDTLWESVVVLMRSRPWLIVVAPLWLFAGRASFKRAVAGYVNLNPAALPYREDLIDALRTSRERGRKVVLATAADRQVAERVAQHLAIFDDVFASDGKENLKAQSKRDRLKEAFGDGGFDYVGDSSADLAIFEAAQRGYLVSASSSTSARAAKLGKVSVMSRKPSLVRALLKQLRLHQWAKNALVFLPVLLAPAALSVDTIAKGLLAALAFSLCASAGYVFNDLLDLEADRAHATKKNRPLASGALPVLFGPPLFVCLLVSSFGLSAWLLPIGFSLMLVLYFVGTLSYSLYLKRRLVMDVLVLAGLYTHRILSGGIATKIPISAWLLGFSMFLFLSLAFAKRFVELRELTAERIKNRNYYKADLQMVASMGPASGYIAALVFSLYVENADIVTTTYREPTILWLIVPVLLYWISRVWILAGRGELQDDPVKFALKDRLSLLCGAVVGVIAVTARFTPHWLSGLLHGA